jgi:hypothetical protein
MNQATLEYLAQGPLGVKQHSIKVMGAIFSPHDLVYQPFTGMLKLGP